MREKVDQLSDFSAFSQSGCMLRIEGTGGTRSSADRIVGLKFDSVSPGVLGREARPVVEACVIVDMSC